MFDISIYHLLLYPSIFPFSCTIVQAYLYLFLQLDVNQKVSYFEPLFNFVEGLLAIWDPQLSLAPLAHLLAILGGILNLNFLPFFPPLFHPFLSIKPELQLHFSGLEKFVWSLLYPISLSLSIFQAPKPFYSWIHFYSISKPTNPYSIPAVRRPFPEARSIFSQAKS